MTCISESNRGFGAEKPLNGKGLDGAQGCPHWQLGQPSKVPSPRRSHRKLNNWKLPRSVKRSYDVSGAAFPAARPLTPFALPPAGVSSLLQRPELCLRVKQVRGAIGRLLLQRNVAVISLRTLSAGPPVCDSRCSTPRLYDRAAWRTWMLGGCNKPVAQRVSLTALRGRREDAGSQIGVSEPNGRAGCACAPQCGRLLAAGQLRLGYSRTTHLVAARRCSIKRWHLSCAPHVHKPWGTQGSHSIA